MKITGFELFKVPPRWLFLKLDTDEGIVGWGEPVLEGHADTVAACVAEMSEYFIGKDPRDIEDLWQVLYRGGFYRGGGVLNSAIAGIEQAMWDIKGKFYGMPVWEFLGGKCRDKIEVYSWVGGDSPADVQTAARERQQLGFRAVKMNGTGPMGFIDSFDKLEEVVQRVASVREACGSAFGIALDFHGRVHKTMAKQLAKELDPYKLMFIEEPVLCENYESFAEIAHYTSIPIATGERLYSRWDFKKIFAQGVVDIVQPDLSHCGGIWEGRKIAAMAEAYDMAVALHCPLGPIALAACLQVDACTHNAFIQEQSLGIHYNQGGDLLDYLQDPTIFHYEEGCVKVPERPGLGIEVNEAYVRRQAEIGHDWKNPLWRNPDGTVSEW